MKKTVIGAVCLLMLLGTSCIKKYSCKCTTTISAQFYYPHVTETRQPIEKITTKKRAQDICDNTAHQLAANARLIISGNWDVSSKCEVKDN